MGTRSLYDELGVPRTATGQEIRVAYRRAAKRAHPDTGGSRSAFEQVNAAYRVLSDPARRQAYDQWLGAGPPAPPGPDDRSTQARPPTPGSPRAPDSPRRRPAGGSAAPVPAPDRRARIRYFVLMGICLLLFVLAGTVVRHYSVPAAMVMMGIAMVIPPIAALMVNRPPRGP